LSDSNKIIRVGLGLGLGVGSGASDSLIADCRYGIRGDQVPVAVIRCVILNAIFS